MDTASLRKFIEREVGQIRHYITYLKYVDDLVKIPVSRNTPRELRRLKIHHETKYSDRKVFEYKAIIISLYGLLERYIEIWIKDYLDAIANLVSYNELDEKIRESHFELSTKLISMLIEDKWGKYDFLSKEGVLKNLHNCTENQPNYKLNAEAFTIQSGNLKHNRITLIFDNLNIKLNEKLIKNEALNQITGIDKKRIKNTNKDILYAKINDIVDRRNDIAHGTEIDNLLGSSELISYIDFLEKYCQAIFDVLMQEYLRLESKHKFQQVEVVHKVLQRSIVAFEIEQYAINQGDMLIVETADGSFYKKEILELQKDNEKYLTLSITSKEDIAVRVKPPINENCTFYIQKK